MLQTHNNDCCPCCGGICGHGHCCRLGSGRSSKVREESGKSTAHFDQVIQDLGALSSRICRLELDAGSHHVVVNALDTAVAKLYASRAALNDGRKREKVTGAVLGSKLAPPEGSLKPVPCYRQQTLQPILPKKVKPSSVLSVQVIAHMNRESPDVVAEIVDVLGVAVLPKEGELGNQVVWHYSQTPFIALCGADYPNMRTTQQCKHVTCPQCRDLIIEANLWTLTEEEKEQVVAEAGKQLSKPHARDTPVVSSLQPIQTNGDPAGMFEDFPLPLSAHKFQPKADGTCGCPDDEFRRYGCQCGGK